MDKVVPWKDESVYVTLWVSMCVCFCVCVFMYISHVRTYYESVCAQINMHIHSTGCIIFTCKKQFNNSQAKNAPVLVRAIMHWHERKTMHITLDLLELLERDCNSCSRISHLLQNICTVCSESANQ
jgi:hypothetical protein